MHVLQGSTCGCSQRQYPGCSSCNCYSGYCCCCSYSCCCGKSLSLWRVAKKEKISCLGCNSTVNKVFNSRSSTLYSFIFTPFMHAHRRIHVHPPALLYYLKPAGCSGMPLLAAACCCILLLHARSSSAVRCCSACCSSSAEEAHLQSRVCKAWMLWPIHIWMQHIHTHGYTVIKPLNRMDVAARRT